MAEALRCQWQKVFKYKWVDRGVLEEWFKDLQMSRGDEKASGGGDGEAEDDAHLVRQYLRPGRLPPRLGLPAAGGPGGLPNGHLRRGRNERTRCLTFTSQILPC